MELTTTSWSSKEAFSLAGQTNATCKNVSSSYSYQVHKLFSPIRPYTFPHLRIKPCSFTLQAKSIKNSHLDPVLKPTIVQEVLMEDDFEDDDLLLDDDGDFDEDYFEEEDAEPSEGDGEGGGGISLAGTSWDKEALALAEEVALSFEGDLGIYAFKTLLNSIIRVRVEKLSNKSGSPNMEDIEAFSLAYTKRLHEAELAGSIPENISLEVSSPGVERIIRIPQDLDRFKDRAAIYVKYVSDVADTGTSTEKDGIFKLISFDLETKTCSWGIADVRQNREKAGKGRPLNKKQREWRLVTPFDSLRLVRFYPLN